MPKTRHRHPPITTTEDPKVNEVGATYADGGNWVISDYVTTNVFQYLVFDDLQDCTGVSRFFHKCVAMTVKYMSRRKILSTAYFAPSRVSQKLARVRVGLSGPVANKVSNFRAAAQTKLNHKTFKSPALTICNMNQNPLALSTLASLPRVPVRKPHLVKKSTRSQKRSVIGKSNIVKSSASHAGKENGSFESNTTVTSTIPIPTACVHCIQKPQKAIQPREIPTPPLAGNNQRGIQKHRVVIRRKKPLKHFCDMLEKDFLFKWRDFKMKKNKLR